MTDIVERLRQTAHLHAVRPKEHCCWEAADEIESLRFQLNGVIKMRNEIENEITKLRAALERIYQYSNQPAVIEISRAALGGDNG